MKTVTSGTIPICPKCILLEGRMCEINIDPDRPGFVFCRDHGWYTSTEFFAECEKSKAHLALLPDIFGERPQ